MVPLHPVLKKKTLIMTNQHLNSATEIEKLKYLNHFAQLAPQCIHLSTTFQNQVLQTHIKGSIIPKPTQLLVVAVKICLQA